MQTWEMVKELTENPTKEFERVGDRKTFKASPKIKGGLVITHYVSDLHTSFECITLTDDWELVRTPVNFLAATESGKDIRPEGYGGAYYSLAYWLNGRLDASMICGKWLIE